MRLLSFITIMLFGLMSTGAIAAPLLRDQVPEPLQPWVDWVLQDTDGLNCPYVYNQKEQACVWPSTLNLVLTDSGGSFSQDWQVFAKTLVQLPGESLNWPQNVRDESGELIVQAKDGVPHVELDVGRHSISGEFHWQSPPKSLLITPESGLMTLSLNGQQVEYFQFNQQGQLWLTQGDLEVASEDNLDIQVFRKITDSHPVQINTTIKLRVSGKQRNITLDSAVLEGFIGQKINSLLPARLSRDNKLKLQLRPGQWVIEVIARAPADITEFKVPQEQASWPNREVWVYESNTAIRQAKVVGPTSIDPSQTQLPNNWKALPAYLLSSGESFTLDVSQRGATDSGHDELNLNRQLWLDYDGKGYTIRDHISGTLSNPRRLDVLADLQLGRVSIDDEAQFITYGSDGSNVGVEVRQSELSLVAESRYTGKQSTPPVNGWQHDLNNVQTTLHLPPGWRLFAANGTDNVPDSWLQSWSLLDLFLVLVIAISVAYLYGVLWAAFTLICLVFIWHEPGAPRYIWLNLLALVALLRVLPVGRLKQTLQFYRAASLIALLLIVIPYTIDTIRVSLYPQLEISYYNQHRFGDEPAFSGKVYNDDAMLQEERVSAVVSSSRKMLQPELYSQQDKYAGGEVSGKRLNALDPDSKIQTGFGLPTWKGRQPISLYWSGPVKADESSRLLILGPLSNLLIRVTGIALILMLSWRLMSLGREFWPKPSVSLKSLLPLFFALSLSPMLLLTSNPLQAETLPDEQMLESLRSRLTAAPDCLPNCAQIETMDLTIDDDALYLRLRIHTTNNTAIPLPGRQGLWLPSEVLIEGEPAKAMQRDTSQNLWIALEPGLHDVVMRGPLPKRNSVALPIPLKPHYIEWRSFDTSWTLEGVENNTAQNGQLQINRTSQNTEDNGSNSGESILPVFVKVERLITLGLDWNVRTTVTGLAPGNSPIGLSIPLIEGEQVLSEVSGVDGGAINIAMSSRQNEFTWTSRLDITSALKLTAAKNNNYLESWLLAVGPTWHIESEGIPYNETSEMGATGVTVWRPWPEEILQLSISRPAGVGGQSVTILSSKVLVSSGKRANDVELSVNFLTSRGVSHDISLPNGATVQSVTVGGKVQRIVQNNNSLKIPLVPGKQAVQIKWRDEQSLTTRFQFPDIDLGISSVNSWFSINPGSSRWVVWVRGPVSGPAVLFWGVLLALLVLALGLSKSKLTPLKTWQWFLLSIGLSQTETILMVVVIAWLVAIAVREKQIKPLLVWQFNLMQVGLVLISLVALGVLAVAVGNGLLGSPDMQIVGNGSSSFMLNWYQDRSESLLPQPEIYSVPMWIYRTLMLLWALWLAKSVISWLSWEWSALNVGGIWKKKVLVETTTK